MSYHHLTTFERAKIGFLLEYGFSQTSIAEHLGRSRSTISREIKRNSQNGKYKPEKAQQKYKSRRANCGRKGKYSQDLASLGIPCALSARIGKDKIGKQMLNQLKKVGLDLSSIVFSQAI